MKIILIQQAQTDMPWAPRCSAQAFARAAEEELSRGAAPVSVRRSDAAAYRVYTGTNRASRETAELLFSLSGPPTQTPLLDEAAPQPFRDTQTEYPLSLWRTMAEVQWALGSARQGESREETLRRAGEFVDRLEEEEWDSVVICRSRIMASLKTVLRRRGYLLEGGGLRSRPLERVRASKRSLHCGGCHHNCLLTEAKCHIGQSKARSGGLG